MLFGVGFIKKTAKKKEKKEHGGFENLLPHISTLEAL